MNVQKITKTITSAEIVEKTVGIYEEAVSLRRKIHEHPELGFEEYKTAELIATYLQELGIEVTTGVAETGVVGILRGELEGPVLALRADIDALPIQEKTTVSYKSKNPGIMHACGHDMHTAMLLSAAKILSENKQYVSGTIKFIFQPAEEMKGGGIMMVEEGVLSNPPVDHAFAFHVWPELPTGVYGFRNGPMMASMDTFDVVLTGKQGHGAAPHQGVDAIVGACHVVTALQTIVSRETDPVDSAVITIGTIEAGDGYNIIPEKARFKGTVRTLNENTRKEVQNSIKRIIEGVAAALKLEVEINYNFTVGYPVTMNDIKFNEHVACIATDLFGENSVQWMSKPSMASEDFAFYLDQVPGTFVFLGVGENPEEPMKLHSDVFLPDEKAMIRGISLIVGLALNTTEKIQ
ncbi:M20 metallopeptidase family protein [Peribacillus huizhouensis]|uniref:Amidohydrolase/hippurate hydrolase n=1 Tax=Peribacillus huizhouensis TaxID=1501239 RepID=A0ABR6CMF2_9BACI|nr:M20 family metallopeptidase [Peribacillus huizhouensis]MBA9026109.1 amidohydrolase/hippurate hydrolase [Peribacillus huizhouensis]